MIINLKSQSESLKDGMANMQHYSYIKPALFSSNQAQMGPKE